MLSNLPADRHEPLPRYGGEACGAGAFPVNDELRPDMPDFSEPTIIWFDL